jgi:hypothetical protein
MKVRIIKWSSPEAWYARGTDSIFTVKDYQLQDKFEVIEGEKKGFLINKQNCEIVEK